MASWWIYKCNGLGMNYQRAVGDWQDYFAGDRRKQWGSTKWTPPLEALRKGDMIIAYQTDRNALMGLLRVRQTCEKDTYLYLDVVESVTPVRVRPLKRSDRQIAIIQALQPGPIRTIYEISYADAKRLLMAAGFKYQFH